MGLVLRPMCCPRVFLIGGADARANEAVPVFMPTRFVDNQMLARTLTLPKGYFSARSTSPELIMFLLHTKKVSHCKDGAVA